jgi:hypothetical protein
MSQTLTPLVTVALPCVLPTPNLQGFLVTATTGGTLAAATYGYRITARVGSVETAACPTIAVTTTGSTSTVTVAWLPVPGATDYRVYGRTTGSELLIATVAAPLTSYVDTGSVSPSGALPGATGFAETLTTPGLYAAPSGCKSVTIKGIVVSNPTVNAGQVFLSRVPIGGSGGAATRILGGALSRPDAFSSSPDIDLSRLHILNGQPSAAGDFVTGYATVPGLVLSLDGLVNT